MHSSIASNFLFRLAMIFVIWLKSVRDYLAMFVELHSFLLRVPFDKSIVQISGQFDQVSG